MLYNLFLFIQAVCYLIFKGVLIRVFRFRKGLKEQIATVYSQKGEEVHQRYFKRIFYYGFLGSIFNEWFIILRGYAPSDKEAKASFYLGSATAVYDDLFDRYNYTMKESLEDLAIGRYKYDNVTERLSKQFYDVILENIADEARFASYLKKVGFFQEESKKQETADLSEKEIRRITYEKGGYSVALSRSTLKHDYRKGEEEAVYLLGALIQMTDDVFDIRKDHLQNVSTLPSTATDIREIRTEYETLIQQTFTAFKQLDYPSKNLRRFFMHILIIVSRGMVCFNQLVRVQEKHGDAFQIEKYNRAELVCDMERPINMWRSFWYCLKWKM